MKAFTPYLLASAAALQVACTSALSIKTFARSSDPSSGNTTALSSAEAHQQNLTSLIHPNCTASATATWCGIVLGMTAHKDVDDNVTTLYNVSITDSSCTRVGRVDGILQNSTTNISTSVGDWTFEIYKGSGLDITYNGLDIGNTSILGVPGADSALPNVELLNLTADVFTSVVFGAYGNCTPASEADQSKSEGHGGSGAQIRGALASVGLLGISMFFLGLL